MKLMQILLPLYDNRGNAFPKPMFDRVREELRTRFGGVTAWTRSPAVGLWQDDAGAVRRDDVVLFDVMAEHIDREWWTAFRHDLQARFRQDDILIRATDVELL